MKRDRKSRSDGISSMFVGMDLHKNYLQVATMDNKGKVLQNRRVINNMNQISRFFRTINPEAKVVMESS